jgi:hypothetical protein
MDWIDLVQDKYQAEGSCEHGNEPSASQKGLSSMELNNVGLIKNIQTYYAIYSVSLPICTVPTAVEILRQNSFIFSHIAPRSLLKINRRFGAIFRVYLQGRRISKARNQREAGSKQSSASMKRLGIS